MSSVITLRLKRRRALSIDSPSCSRISAKLVTPSISGKQPSGAENIWAQSFAAIPHASSKSWGTYLLSLYLCAHSFNGIELRYSFSDIFNRRTICSNELGVLGMSSEGLPQFR